VDHVCIPFVLERLNANNFLAGFGGPPGGFGGPPGAPRKFTCRYIFVKSLINFSAGFQPPPGFQGPPGAGRGFPGGPPPGFGR
jgi:small nuclear ribonucleoprotein B and B'